MWAMQFEDMDGSFTTKHFEALSATFLGDIAYGELRKRRAFMVTLLNSVPLQEDTTYRRKICLSVLVGECML
jgi:hypothetical protein